ncbi:MAG: cytochrome c [Pseudomonadota bacterium]
MKKTSIFTGVVLSASLAFGFGAQVSAEEALYKVDGNNVDEATWVGSKIYDRAFGRGCGTCHDIQSNPNLLESVKKLSKEEFVTVLKNGKKAMPKAVDAMMKVGPVKKANMTEEQAIDAIYAYLVGRSKGDIPAGKLNKMK